MSIFMTEKGITKIKI